MNFIVSIYLNNHQFNCFYIKKLMNFIVVTILVQEIFRRLQKQLSDYLLKKF